MTFKKYILGTLVLSLILACSCRSLMSEKWWEASRDSAGISVQPQDESRPVVQVYYARAFSWKGVFGVHSWIAYKAAGASEFITAHVMGWRVKRGQEAVVVKPDVPDRFWFGSEPTMLFELVGDKAEPAIPQIQALIASYPYRDQYRVWPGPNSNTFISYLIRETPELTVELPPNAIGKDWLPGGMPIGWAQTGSGFQCSLFGALGFTIAWAEGVELNLLGAVVGLDFWTPALKLPLIGRVGFADKGY